MYLVRGLYFFIFGLYFILCKQASSIEYAPSLDRKYVYVLKSLKPDPYFKKIYKGYIGNISLDIIQNYFKYFGLREIKSEQFINQNLIFN